MIRVQIKRNNMNVPVVSSQRKQSRRPTPRRQYFVVAMLVVVVMVAVVTVGVVVVFVAVGVVVLVVVVACVVVFVAVVVVVLVVLVICVVVVCVVAVVAVVTVVDVVAVVVDVEVLGVGHVRHRTRHIARTRFANSGVSRVLSAKQSMFLITAHSFGSCRPWQVRGAQSASQLQPIAPATSCAVASLAIPMRGAVLCFEATFF